MEPRQRGISVTQPRMHTDRKQTREHLKLWIALGYQLDDHQGQQSQFQTCGGMTINVWQSQILRRSKQVRPPPKPRK